MSKVDYSPQALEDLKILREYISTNRGENIAKEILTKITSDIRRLELFPMSGVELAKIIDITTDYRYLYSERNYVFYRLELDRVLIVRVLSEKRDYLQHLFGSSSKSDE
jgi:plasmid stabilization system protein ParE